MRFFPEIARDRSRHDATPTVVSLAARLRLVAAAIADRSSLPQPAFELATALTVLWTRAHSFDAADPAWADRDRFVLSHVAATPLFYALLHLTGHAGMEQETLDQCGDPDAVASSAAEQGRHSAVAAPAGQAIAIAVGMAQAERVLAARFGKSFVDHRVWAVAHADELGHGIVAEAASLAGLGKFDRLALLIDATDKGCEDARSRFAALGWAVKAAPAEDPQALEAAFSFAQRSRKPTLIWCEPDSVRQVPPASEEAWRPHGGNGSASRRAWLKRVARHPQRAEFDRAMAGRLPEGWNRVFAANGCTPPHHSPAEAANTLLSRLLDAMPDLLGSRLNGVLEELADSSRLVDHGHRPHGMVAIANGAALHAGVLPFTAGTLLDTAEQLPALRLAAAAGHRAVHLCFDHGLAAPGLAWQPACLLAMLRTLPGMHVFRPACATETAECLELALQRKDGPCLLVLSREESVSPRGHAAENRAARGAYVRTEAEGKRQATLLATGAELHIALQARALLAEEDISVAVVSFPCWALFAAQDEAYRNTVLGSAPRIGIEAGARDGWDRWIGADGLFVGAAPASAGPAAALRRRLGLMPEAIAALVRRAVPRHAPLERVAPSEVS